MIAGLGINGMLELAYAAVARHTSPAHGIWVIVYCIIKSYQIGGEQNVMLTFVGGKMKEFSTVSWERRIFQVGVLPHDQMHHSAGLIELDEPGEISIVAA